MSGLLEVRNVTQEYPGVRALNGVTLGVDRGEVLGLVGENGAGKSTLIRIMAGIERPTTGSVAVKGEDVTFRSSAESQAAGITVVSQEFRLVSELSVADNVFLGHERTRGLLIDRKSTRQRAKDLLEQLGLDLDPDAMVSSLTIGDRQLVEIARALSREFDVLVMDEPTATLNGAEIERLHQIVNRIAAQGKAIIYVSHHLDEIFSICSDVAVLRDGTLVAHQKVDELDEDRMIELMLGRSPEALENHSTIHHARETRLEVIDVESPGIPGSHSFTVGKGEILGLAGLVGSGRTELMRGLFGDLPFHGGKVLVDGAPARLGSVRQAIRSGFFMLSEDRKGEGILPHLDVTENAMVSRDLKGASAIKRVIPMPADERDQFGQLRSKMRIRVRDGKQLIGKLSGGNQQKVLLGRALLSGCSVLLLNEPTRGVDVGAKVEIYQLIRELADSGVAVIVSSSDAPELAAIADRCIVYFAGRQTAELRGNDITEENIVSASVGQELGGVDDHGAA